MKPFRRLLHETSDRNTQLQPFLKQTKEKTEKWSNTFQRSNNTTFPVVNKEPKHFLEAVKNDL